MMIIREKRLLLISFFCNTIKELINQGENKALDS